MLVEALVALSVLTVGFLGILTLLSQSTALTRVIGDNYTATYLAAEGIEIVKSFIDSNVMNVRKWNDGLEPNLGPYGFFTVDIDDVSPRPIFGRLPLYFDPGDKLYIHNRGNNLPTPFQRYIKVYYPPDGDPDGSEMQVISTVSWLARGGNTAQVILEDHFYNWRP